MNILVAISSVPDTTSRINFKDNDTQLDLAGVSFVINPNDDYGLNKAIQLKETHLANVTVVSVGDASAEATLRKAIALGADRAVRIDSVALSGFQVAYQIAELVKKESFDLIITGKESIDFNGAMVGAMISALTEIPFIPNCTSIEVQADGVLLKSETEDAVQTLSAKLPVVISAQKGLVEDKDLKIPNMRGIMAARTKPIDKVEASPVPSLQQIVHYEKPAKRAEVKIISADDLSELVTFLKSQKTK